MLKLFKKLKPYTLTIIFGIICVIIQTISELILPSRMGDIVDYGIMNKNIEYITSSGLLMLLISIAGTFFAILASYFCSKTSVRFGRDLREEVFTKIESFSLAEFEKFGAATLITRTTNDITQVQQVVYSILRLLVLTPIMFVGGIIMAINTDVELSTAILVVLPVMAVLIVYVVKKCLPLFTGMQNKVDKVNRVLREKLTGIRVIRAFNKDEYERKRFDKVNTELKDVGIKINKLVAVLLPLVVFLFNFTIVVILWFGSNRIDKGLTDVGKLTSFVQYITMIMFSLAMSAVIFIMIPRAQISATRINEILLQQVSIKDNDFVNNKPDLNQKDDTIKNKGLIEFKNVSFNFDDAEQKTLSNINFTAKPGQITAILGGTGSGKSTLINLIPRFFDVTEGNIFIDGKDIREFSLYNLRNKISIVSQKAMLFSGTVAENIRFGKPDASKEEIEEALKTAQALDFVNNLDGGTENIVSQGGSNLSGGQKQRLTIAKALVRNSEIYIFDDNFSALDYKTDAKLRIALKDKVKDAVVIIVAQRVSTVINADQIIVLNDGSIAGIGTHTELKKSCEIYREIVASQMSEEELDL